MAYKHIPIVLETAAPVSPFDDPECQYVALPQTMATFAAPALDKGQTSPEGLALLRQLAENLDLSRNGKDSSLIDLSGTEAPTRNFLDQMLGRGEIDILAEGPEARLQGHETVFTGIWWIREKENGGPSREYLEAGAIPRGLPQWLETLNVPPPFPAEFPSGLMNAPSLIHELFAKSAGFRPGNEAIINLTLLPMTPEDLAFLRDALGMAGVFVLSKGYGECRISRTRLPNVWWVQYFNSTGQMILNTLELTFLPAVAYAAPEDLDDSAVRLTETLNI